MTDGQWRKAEANPVIEAMTIEQWWPEDNPDSWNDGRKPGQLKDLEVTMKDEGENDSQPNDGRRQTDGQSIDYWQTVLVTDELVNIINIGQLLLCEPSDRRSGQLTGNWPRPEGRTDNWTDWRQQKGQPRPEWQANGQTESQTNPDRRTDIGQTVMTRTVIGQLTIEEMTDQYYCYYWHWRTLLLNIGRTQTDNDGRTKPIEGNWKLMTEWPN